MFGKFTQVDSSDQRQVGGTGLGMHISKQIVERHNGVIDYTSVVGQGTTFFVEFAEKKIDRGRGTRGGVTVADHPALDFRP